MTKVSASKIRDARPDPRGWADAALELGEAPFLWVDRQLARALPSWLNPAAHTGALANACLLVATASGILLLFWYSPSVHGAHASVRAMDQAPWTSGLVRSLHRYSADLAVLFALWHAARLLLARRTSGPRARAWLTGVLALGTLGFLGWTGYWLVWDQRAQLVAQTTARLMDPLPVFTEPLSRSFLVDERVNSLLFFVVFFIHLLVPMVAVLLLWLHVTRLARPRFLPPRALWVALVGVLLALSLGFSAQSAGPARMQVSPESLSLDAWYLLPLYLTGKVGVGVLWGVSLGVAALLFAVPRLLSRGRRAPVAEVHPEACNGCTLCFEDCPYEAITMVPREDGSRFSLVAKVDPAACVGCGICAGSCVPGGIGVPQLPVIETRKRMDRWVADALATGEAPMLALVCASASGARLTVDPQTGVCPQLPGHRVLAVPCAASVQTLTLERALKRGAAGVALVGCGPTECTYREGGLWMQARLAGQREPKLRADKVEAGRIRFLQADRLRELSAVLGEAPRVVTGRARPVLSGIAVALLLAGITAAWSVAPYRAVPPPAELVVSFRHPGQRSEGCRKPSEAELAALPPHMRRPEICERSRAPVRLRITVDGEGRLERTYPGRGLQGDGNSVGIERLPVPPGEHLVRVELGDSPDPDAWGFDDTRTMRFSEGQSVVVLFDRTGGFSWHATPDLPDTAPPTAEARRDR